MPQSNINNEGQRRGSRLHSCKIIAQVNNGVPGTDLVNEAVHHNGFTTSARTSESTTNGTVNRNTPPLIVNGHINNKCKGYVRKTAPPNIIRKQGSRISAVTEASASGRAVSTGMPDDVPVNGEAASLPCNSDQMKPERSHEADATNHRPWKKSKSKKRVPKGNCAKIPTSPPMAPFMEEDWEKEIEEVTLTGWENMCYGLNPYGPEDLLHFDLRDLTLKQRDRAPLLVTANYCPAIHHPRPFRWTCFNVPVETDQFADADE